MLVAVVCFSSVPLFLRHFTSRLDAWTVNAVRYSVASLFWLPAILRRLKARPECRSVWRDAAVPAIVNLAAQILWALTPYYNPASIMAFGIRLSFPFALIFGMTWLRDERALARVPAFWIGTAASLTGLVLMFAPSNSDAGIVSPFGLLLLGACAALWGLYFVTVKIFVIKHPPDLSFGVISVYTAASLVAVMLVAGNYSDLIRLDAGNWALLILSGVVGIAFSHVLSYKAMAVVGAIPVSGSHMLMPFLTWAAAAALLGETLAPIQWQGGIVIVLGALLLLLAQSRVSKPL